MGCGGIAAEILTTEIDGGEWTALRPDHYFPGQISPCSYWIGGCVGPRVCLNSVKNRSCRESNQGFPVRSPSLYWLCYPTLTWRRNIETSYKFSSLEVGIHTFIPAGGQRIRLKRMINPPQLNQYSQPETFWIKIYSKYGRQVT